MSIFGSFVTSAAVVLMTLAMPSHSHASCNTIPSIGSMNGMAALSNPSSPQPPPLRYKGALGRIDPVHFVIGHSRSIVVSADGVCVSNPTRPTDADMPEDAVAILLLGVGTTAPVLAYAPGEGCKLLSSMKREIAAATQTDGKPTLELVGNCGEDDVTVVPLSGSSKGLRVPLPTASQVSSILAARDGEELVPSARVIVMRRPTSGEGLASTLATLATSDCASSCETFARDGGLACIDSVYALETVDGTAQFRLDTIPCDVEALVLSNDFGERCENDVPGFAACGKNLKVLDLWYDSCEGGVHIPFDWTSIRKDPAGGASDRLDRRVSGRTAATKKHPTKDKRFFVPGREFLGSTPFDDPNAEQPGTDWRRPQIDIGYPDAQQFEITGIVDADNSIIHIYPKLAVKIVCEDGQACFSAAPVNGSGDGCACRDRFGPDCKCSFLSEARYFACSDAGDLDGMPCTRPDHCNTTGKCTKTTRCKPKDTVWDKGIGNASGSVCAKQCSGNQMCGYVLFDPKDHVVGGVGRKITLDANILSGGSRKRRGVCKPGGQACSNDPPPPTCPDAGDECRGYVLNAGGQP